jgi:hypothetical protein
LLDRAAIHHGDDVAQHQRLLLVVRHEERRHLELAHEGMELDLHRFAQLAVQRAERFVEDQDGGLHRERARQRDALLLAAGELGRIACGQMVEPHELQHPPRLALALLGRHLLHLRAEPDVVEHRHVREQREALEHHADVARGGAPAGHVLAVIEHLPRGGAQQAGDDAQRAALAASARPEQRGEIAGADDEADVIDGDDLAVAGDDAAECDFGNVSVRKRAS